MQRILLLCLAMASAASFAQMNHTPPKAPSRVSIESKGRLVKASALEQAKARKLLEQSLARFPVANVRTIISQRVDYDSSVMQQIKVEMSPSGKLHQIVIAPLRYQGYETIDDGDVTRTYSPDDRSVIVQPSAKQSAIDAKARMKLVDRNYEIRIERKETIAGRTALVVVAVPVNDELETRCYAIDEKTGFMLRLETCKENAEPVLHFEAKMIEFPASFPERTFHLDTQGAYVKKFVATSYGGPNVELRQKLGFDPIVPPALPMGFVVEELQADTEAPLPAVGIRLTDGLAKATVYQWPRRGVAHNSAPQGTLVANTRGLTLLISGDLPENVKSRILDSFVRAARDHSLALPALVASWALELRCQVKLFSLDGDGEGWPRLVRSVPEVFRP